MFSMMKKLGSKYEKLHRLTKCKVIIVSIETSMSSMQSKYRMLYIIN